ncbi:MAG TPA: hypothetical protein GXX13_09310 [Acinetobacter towneri]|nr:hypothetical protein [Acinetobacter towneri]
MSFITTDTNPLYQGWVDNVKNLKKAKSNLVRLINRQIKLSKTLPSGDIRPCDLHIISNLSKSAFLIYSSYTEANLLKLIHLPNSFDKQEVEEILKVKKNKNIIEAWLKAINLASMKNNVSIVGVDSIETCERSLKEIVHLSLKDPSEIRNKIVHGQWSTVYNSRYLALNNTLTMEVENIDIAKIDGWYLIFDKLAELLKQLIQSPNKGFPVQYSRLIDEINNLVIETQSWNITTKRSKLLKLGPIPSDQPKE